MKITRQITPCRNCSLKQAAGTNSCPFARKDMCPEFQASIATLALEWKDAALCVPLEALLTALRFHGYTGELRKTSTVII